MPSPASPAPPCRAHSALPPRRPRARASPSMRPAPLFAAGALTITNPGARLRGDGRGGQRRTGEGAGPREGRARGRSADLERAPPTRSGGDPKSCREKRTRTVWSRQLRRGARGFMGLRAGPLRPSPWLSPAAARMVRPSPFPPCSVKALTFLVHLLGASSRNTPQWGTPPLHRTEKQVTNKSLQRMTILRVMKVQEGHVMVTCREVVLGLPRTGHLSQDPKDEGVGKWAKCAKVLRP